MDLSDVVSVKRFLEFTAEQKEELYETLLDLAQAIDEIPKKSLRKTLDITLAVLQYKGEKVQLLQDQVGNLDNSKESRLVDENTKLKSMLESSEKDNRSCVNKVKSLTNEVFALQKRLEEVSKTGEISDRDSSDPLSELDKQEELLKNINVKNKHIKRLLREIESLQTQNIEQSKLIIDLEAQIQQAKDKVLQLSADITVVDNERKALKQTVNELKVEISRLEENVTYLEEDRERSEQELKAIIKKLDAKSQSHKKLLHEKDQQLKKLGGARVNTIVRNPLTASSTNEVNTDDEITTEGDRQKAETEGDTTKLHHIIECRDKLIEQLEFKIKVMAEEMLSSTVLMDKISAERLEQQQTGHKPRACCKVIEESLRAANARCRELSGLLERSEDDNLLKSKQALQATTALDAYQRGEDGLIKALKKCASLEHKILSRDKQIQTLVMELNTLHQVAQENILLRKRLKIPDDEVIVTKSIVAKERSKDKIIERLKLKLRASEEMRLQLKMQKADLRTELIALEKKHSHQNVDKSEDKSGFPSEVGEVVEEESKQECCGQLKEDTTTVPYQCKEFASTPTMGGNPTVPTDVDYLKLEEVLTENDSLRQGMLEILEKLREYDASSEHVTIDADILLRLLQVLRKSNERPPPVATAPQMEHELQSLKLRERALQEMRQQHQTAAVGSTLETSDDFSSVESVREDGEVRLNHTDLPLEVPEVINCSTRPTTPNRALLDQSLFPMISAEESYLPMKRIDSDQIRALHLQIIELQVYRQRYDELKQMLDDKAAGVLWDGMGKASVECITKLQLDLSKKCKCYEYLREDFDLALSGTKQNEMKHATEVAKLRSRINELLVRMSELEELCSEQRANMPYSTDEYLALQRANTELQAQVAYIVQHILNGKLAPELAINDICTEYGIIKENLQLDYLTSEEYEQLQNNVKDLLEEKTKLVRKCNQLEGLLEVAQEQIRSQQKLLNDLTDNHINLRHLVADLQSDSEDKLILAKLQRDLNAATSETDNLKLEREQLKERCLSLERKIDLKEQQTAQLKERFQVDQRLKDTKLKFVTKSLFALKEKYAKFTPLIFLTNFVFAYTRFTKRMIETETKRELKLTAKIKEILEELVVTSQVAKFSEQRDESQNLVKLVKAETQNRLLEEQLISLKRAYQDLQQEMTQQCIRNASNDVHWKTVQLLYELNENESRRLENKDQGSQTRREDFEINGLMENKATNTDVPLPVERKLSVNGGPNKQPKEIMVNKSLSPIGSPIRQAHEIVIMEHKGTLTEGEMEQRNIVAFMTVKEPCSHTEDKEEVYVEDEEQGDKNMGREGKSGLESNNDRGKKEDLEAEIEKEQNEAMKVIGNEQKDQETKTRNNGGDQEHKNETPQKMDAILQTSPEICVKSLGTQTAITENKEDNLQEMQQKLCEAQSLAEERCTRLQETQAKLSSAKLEIEKLRNQLGKAQNKNEESTPKPSSSTEPHILQTQSDIIEKTILSFHTLLSEKDKAVSKYQDLLLAEREQTQKSTSKCNQDIEALKTTLQHLSSNMEIKDIEILELKKRLQTLNQFSQEEQNLQGTKSKGEDSGDNSLNEISDEKIEEMFEQDADSATGIQEPAVDEVLGNVEEKQDTEILNEKVAMSERIKELSAKVSFVENILKTKDAQIFMLKEKIRDFQTQSENRAMERNENPDVEHLKLLLEEKSRQINDLLATLNNFHDDQERYINESTNSTADQISKLAAELTRTEATNKIYRTQVDALRRQLSNLNQREKQARELNQSLRNELIKRPVVSIKSELNARVKNENLNKRIQQLELDLEDARVQIQRQTALIESRKVKSSSEVSLWEKQKRWQQTAEKYKAKLDETECTLEKTKSLLNTARNTIRRLEKEKHISEARLLSREPPSSASSNIRCCNTTSCASRQPSESPGTCTGGSSESSSPAHCANHLKSILPSTHHCCVGASSQGEIIEALKARNELQQRKIATMELESKGSNVLTTELEKLQEKLSACEAQNIRLEARNLQLQLDNDMLKQCDASDRLHKQIKHLEDYIIALKEEIAQSEARRDLCNCSGIKLNIHGGQSAEQTILSLKNLVEKLRAENKYLKDGRRSSENRSAIDLTRGPKGESSVKQSIKYNNAELEFIREQLIKKTKLLQKAKILLTRAAAKEKVLKEQLALWKRKCSELQNVPVIDEISE